MTVQKVIQGTAVALPLILPAGATGATPNHRQPIQSEVVESEVLYEAPSDRHNFGSETLDSSVLYDGLRSRNNSDTEVVESEFLEDEPSRRTSQNSNGVKKLTRHEERQINLSKLCELTQDSIDIEDHLASIKSIIANKNYAAFKINPKSHDAGKVLNKMCTEQMHQDSVSLEEIKSQLETVRMNLKEIEAQLLREGENLLISQAESADDTDEEHETRKRELLLAFALGIILMFLSSGMRDSDRF